MIHFLILVYELSLLYAFVSLKTKQKNHKIQIIEKKNICTFLAFENSVTMQNNGNEKTRLRKKVQHNPHNDSKKYDSKRIVLFFFFLFCAAMQL